MVSVKIKKQLNLPQLIEWAWKNDITNKEYICNEFKKKSVIFNLSGWAEFSDEFSYNPQDTFTVEVEENVTEDTKFKYLVEISTKGSSIMWEHSYINQRIGSQSKEFHAYIDGEFKLIWRDGRLVE